MQHYIQSDVCVQMMNLSIFLSLISELVGWKYLAFNAAQCLSASLLLFGAEQVVYSGLSELC